MTDIFISYSHQDEVWKDKLQAPLRALQLHNDFEVWDDRQIELGENWLPAIENAIERARVAVLLVSNDFLASDFVVKKEIPRLLKRRADQGLKVVPVVVRPCPWQYVSWLAALQGATKDNEPLASLQAGYEEEAALSQIAVQIFHLLDEHKREEQQALQRQSEAEERERQKQEAKLQREVEAQQCRAREAYERQQEQNTIPIIEKQPKLLDALFNILNNESLKYIKKLASYNNTPQGPTKIIHQEEVKSKIKINSLYYDLLDSNASLIEQHDQKEDKHEQYIFRKKICANIIKINKLLEDKELLLSKPKRVFISYCTHKSENKKIIWQLSKKLIEDQIDSRIFDYESHSGEGISEWQDDQIENSDYILYFCSFPQNKNKEILEKHKRFREETRKIRSILIKEKRNEKLIPIISNKEEISFIPDWLSNYPYFGVDDFKKIIIHIKEYKKYNDL